MSELGTEANPLRVAIIGSGPSGFYAADPLLKQTDLVIQVDMYDRLPTPYGLVRGGVAPDHPKIKSVSKVYDKTAANPNFRFYGNVELGKDISHEELKQHYHAIVYAVGSQTDRRLGIPGEDLHGSYPATEFVAWYNAHPDFCHLTFDLSQESVAVIGNGNVAMDVVRILASSYEELRQTDIADYALEALRNSKVKDIYMLGRRGPAQAAFTNPELKEFGELAEADVVISPEAAAADAVSRAALDANPDSAVEKNLKVMAEYAQRPLSGKPKRIHMIFLVSPTEIEGENDHVTAIKLVENQLQAGSDGSLKARATDKTFTLPVGLVFRSIGYMGVPLEGIPFDQRSATIPNAQGRVIDPETKTPVVGEYVVGWIKRGPSGIIGTNRPDSVETVEKLLEDVPTLSALDPTQASRESMEALIKSRQPDYVTYEDWLLLDQIERENGQLQNRPRIKFSRIEDMLVALKKVKSSQVSNPVS
ncbi:MAG: FAD-dependent oxidoreductase [Chloroflexota bacterium]